MSLLTTDAAVLLVRATCRGVNCIDELRLVHANLRTCGQVSKEVETRI